MRARLLILAAGAAAAGLASCRPEPVIRIVSPPTPAPIAAADVRAAAIEPALQDEVDRVGAHITEMRASLLQTCATNRQTVKTMMRTQDFLEEMDRQDFGAVRPEVAAIRRDLVGAAATVERGCAASAAIE